MRNAKGEYVLINGNQIVMILLNYIITRNKELGKLNGNEYIVKTIVAGGLARKFFIMAAISSAPVLPGRTTEMPSSREKPLAI